MPADADKPANLQDGEEVSLLGDDEVFESPDFLALVVLRVLADELGDLVALPKRHHVDGNELNGLCVRDTGRGGGAESCSGQDTDSSLTTAQGTAQGRHGISGG